MWSSQLARWKRNSEKNWNKGSPGMRDNRNRKSDRRGEILYDKLAM